MLEALLKGGIMNKEEIQGYIIITVILIVIGLITHTTINSIKEQEKTYEYAQNGVIGVSNKCYYTDNAYCEVDNKVIKVDNYYEVE